MFVNRTEAGMQLGEKVAQYLAWRPDLNKRAKLLVVGLPRGGVPVAFEVARKLACPLDIIVAKKLPFPGQLEYAIGAVSSDGVFVLNPDIPDEGQWQSYIERERQRLLQETLRAEQRFYKLAEREKSSFKDKVVIVVDDGIATGMTAMAAVETARQRGAVGTILAAPVMSLESYHQLRAYCNEVLAIRVPKQFVAVGKHYLNFDQTDDEEVVNALRKSISFTRQPQLSTQKTNSDTIGI